MKILKGIKAGGHFFYKGVLCAPYREIFPRVSEIIRVGQVVRTWRESDPIFNRQSPSWSRQEIELEDGTLLSSKECGFLPIYTIPAAVAKAKDSAFVDQIEWQFGHKLLTLGDCVDLDVNTFRELTGHTQLLARARIALINPIEGWLAVQTESVRKIRERDGRENFKNKSYLLKVAPHEVEVVTDTRPLG